MASLLYQTIDQLSREKGIDPQIIVSAVEDAMLVATRKYYKTGEDLKAEFNKDTGEVEVYAIKKVVPEVFNPQKEVTLEEARQYRPDIELEGEVHVRKPTDVLGRIAAQTAKQVIYQKVREAERDTVYNEYSGRVAELLNCTVKRVEGPDLIVDIGKAEARLPRREQSRLEQFSVGDRVRAVILRVEKSVKGPQVIVSRAAPELVLRLFEQEVPEIYDGTVTIRASAREAGERTKIAVQSHDRDVDSVGACVGMKGMRVESIRRELRGEKIDIVEYSEDPVLFATNALSPAKISRVAILDASEKHLEVIVDDTQLSLAIGKKGQNVRLASKLMGWRIDIKSEEEKRQEVEWQMGQLVGTGTPLSQLAAISDKLREKLAQHDITTIEQLGERTPEQLEEIPGIGPKMVEKIRAAVQNYWEGSSGEAEAPSPGDAEALEGESSAADTTGETEQGRAAVLTRADQDLPEEVEEELQADDEADRSAPGEPVAGEAGADEDRAAWGEGSVPAGAGGATDPGLTAEAADEALADAPPGEDAEQDEAAHIVRSDLKELTGEVGDKYENELGREDDPSQRPRVDSVTDKEEEAPDIEPDQIVRMPGAERKRPKE